MMGFKKRTPQAKISLCKSVVTDKLYVGLFDNNTPLKFWPYDDFGPAAKDFFIELIKAYDSGYDIACDFPVKTSEGKKLLPQLYSMIGEPGTDTVHALNKRQALKPGQLYSEDDPAQFEIISELSSEDNGVTFTETSKSDITEDTYDEGNNNEDMQEIKLESITDIESEDDEK